MPTRRIRSPCCACAASGHAAVATAEQRDELAPFHCSVPPALPNETIARRGDYRDTDFEPVDVADGQQREKPQTQTLTYGLPLYKRWTSWLVNLRVFSRADIARWLCSISGT